MDQRFFSGASRLHRPQAEQWKQQAGNIDYLVKTVKRHDGIHSSERHEQELVMQTTLTSSASIIRRHLSAMTQIDCCVFFGVELIFHTKLTPLKCPKWRRTAKHTPELMQPSCTSTNGLAYGHFFVVLI